MQASVVDSCKQMRFGEGSRQVGARKAMAPSRKMKPHAFFFVIPSVTYETAAMTVQAPVSRSSDASCSWAAAPGGGQSGAATEIGSGSRGASAGQRVSA